MDVSVPTTAGPNKIPLHPESIRFLQLRKERGLQLNCELSVEEARAQQNRGIGFFQGTYDFDGTITDLSVPSEDVKGGIPIRVYRPKTSRADPAIMMYYHGGGQVVGSIAVYDTCCRMLASLCDVIVVSVEYRLAPEYKLPAGLEDCDNATRWVMNHKVEVGGTVRSAVGVAGDSAGGQSAALSCHYIDGLAFQILIYGRLDEATHYPSFTEFKDAPYMPWEQVVWYKKNRLPDLKESLTNPRFSAIHQSRFEHLPPAMFVVAECDPFRDNSYAYQKKLDEAGVYNEFFLVKGALHGFFTNPGHYKECCGSAYNRIAHFIKRNVYGNNLCDVIVVSVEYRLAPEHKLPAGPEDCDNATRWVMQNKPVVGGTGRSVVGVAGDSAGGQSAALSCHYIKGLSFQVLVYGRLDERTYFPAYTEFKDAPYMPWEQVMWYKKHRLPDLDKSLTNRRFSSLQQTRFDHLPPALFIVAECDPIRDYSFVYQKKLKEVAVYSELHVIKGTLHGFFHNPGTYKECCREAYSKIADFIKTVVYEE